MQVRVTATISTIMNVPGVDDLDEAIAAVQREDFRIPSIPPAWSIDGNFSYTDADPDAEAPPQFTIVIRSHADAVRQLVQGWVDRIANEAMDAAGTDHWSVDAYIDGELLSGESGQAFTEAEDLFIDRSIDGWPRLVHDEHLAADSDHRVPADAKDTCPVCGLAILENPGGNHGRAL